MKRAIQIGLLAVVTATIAVAESNDKPSFTNLSDAVSFITTCLDKDTKNLFSEAFTLPRSGTETHKYVFAELKRINKRTPLPSIYKEREFPTNQASFWLGGHFKELGCVHIGFVHTNGAWCLTDTFICK